MVKWDFDSAGSLCAKQEFKKPAVYLDHWAIRRFAADRSLATRLASALDARQGTWAVSLLNFMEFIQITDKRQAAAFEDLLEQALPNLFFIDFHFLDVIEREKSVLQGRSRNAPYGDVDLFAAFSRTHPDTPRPFTAKAIVTCFVEEGACLKPGLTDLQDTVVGRLRRMREEMTADKDLENSIKRSQRSALAQPTLFLLRELTGSVLRDRSMVPTRNDAMDFLHAVVPVAYCDFALLDAQWENRMRVIGERLVKQNIERKLAVVFSEKDRGVERFLEYFEGSL